MKIRIEYCTAWGYLDKAVGLTKEILQLLKEKVKGIELVPSSGGAYEISVDNEKIYSKLETGQDPDNKWVLRELAERLK